MSANSIVHYTTPSLSVSPALWSTTMHLLLLALFVSIAILVFKSVHSIIWVPWRIQQHFKTQGIGGPGYRPISGNVGELRRMYAEAQSKSMGGLQHDILHRVLPYYSRWSGAYGKTFIWWVGTKPRLALADPEPIKEVFLNTGVSYDKVGFSPLTRPLFGDGLGGLNGEKWALHRRITNQAFNMERVKVIQISLFPLSQQVTCSLILFDVKTINVFYGYLMETQIEKLFKYC